MELRQLKYFLKVAETLNFSSAYTFAPSTPLFSEFNFKRTGIFNASTKNFSNAIAMK